MGQEEQLCQVMQIKLYSACVSVVNSSLHDATTGCGYLSCYDGMIADLLKGKTRQSEFNPDMFNDFVLNFRKSCA